MLRPRCYICGSYNVCFVSSGLSCLDCDIDDSRIVPTGDYEQKCLDFVEWKGTPHMGQRGVAQIVSLLAQAKNPNHKGREWLQPGNATPPMPNQIEMFDREDYRITTPQKELF